MRTCEACSLTYINCIKSLSIHLLVFGDRITFATAPLIDRQVISAVVH